jgi:hypothetical protein
LALTYVIDADARIVSITVTGPTSAQDIADLQARLRDDRSFQPSYHQLFDFRAARLTDIFAPQVEALLSTSPFAVTSRRAYIVSPGSVNYGLGRMAEIMAERIASTPLLLRVFEDIDSAMQWLLEGSDVR